MSHKFKIGEPVRLRNRPYRVVARLPKTGSQEPRYRIRNEEIADDERIVVERDLHNHAPKGRSANI
jgi:hypothetical protein